MSDKDESSGKDGGGGGIPVSNLMSQALRELRLPENESQVSNAPVSTPAFLDMAQKKYVHGSYSMSFLDIDYDRPMDLPNKSIWKQT